MRVFMQHGENGNGIFLPERCGRHVFYHMLEGYRMFEGGEDRFDYKNTFKDVPKDARGIRFPPSFIDPIVDGIHYGNEVAMPESEFDEYLNEMNALARRLVSYFPKNTENGNKNISKGVDSNG